MGCREEILAIVRENGLKEFTPQEIIDGMRKKGTRYVDSTKRTHITSRLFSDAPNNHAKAYDEIVRIRRGMYSLRRKIQ